MELLRLNRSAKVILTGNFCGQGLTIPARWLMIASYEGATTMTVRDDRTSKFALWAADPTVCALPPFQGIPPFRAKKFDSYDAFNRWKRDLLMEIARRGGLTWTK
jgi:hypothetical protein